MKKGFKTILTLWALGFIKAGLKITATDFGPQTGDDAPIALIITIMAVVAVAAIVVLVLMRKNKK